VGLHQLDKVVSMLRLQFEFDDDHESAHRCSSVREIGASSAKRHG
jgi:hypothetical protein